MTPTSLFILTTCCLTAILAIVLLLWHRESRRLGASNADAEARERDAAARLSAAEARLAAAERPRRPSAKSWRRLSGRSSKTSRPKFWANTLCASAKPVRSRSTAC